MLLSLSFRAEDGAGVRAKECAMRGGKFLFRRFWLYKRYYLGIRAGMEIIDSFLQTVTFVRIQSEWVICHLRKGGVVQAAQHCKSVFAKAEMGNPRVEVTVGECGCHGFARKIAAGRQDFEMTQTHTRRDLCMRAICIVEDAAPVSEAGYMIEHAMMAKSWLDCIF